MAKPRRKASKPSPLDERFELRMSPEDVEAFQAAADAYGISLALWLRLAAWKVTLSGLAPAPLDRSNNLSSRLEIRIRSSEKERFRAEADCHGISLGDWTRRAGWHVVSEHDGEVELVKIG